MAIITKPVGGILKGVPATITLNKSELSALASVSADSYFSVITNWNKIILSYKSSEGNQQEVVEFNATLSSPTGFFDVSIKARDLFEIQVIKIIDFDGDIFIIPRSELTTSDFDVEFLNPPSNLSYTTPVTYTQNQQITNNVPTVTGTVTSYSISPALPTGLSINPTTGVISGTPTAVVAATSYTVTASNSGGSTTANISITVEAESTNENIVTFDGRNSSTYISFPEPGKVVRLLPAENLDGNGLGSYWSTQAITGDFTFTATVRAGITGETAVQALFGVNDTIPSLSESPISGYALQAAGWGINFYNSGKVVQPWDVVSNYINWTPGSTYNIEIKRVNGVVSYKVNNTTFTYTLSTSATLYIVGYLQLGSWEVTNASLVLPEVPVETYVIWNNTSSSYLVEADGGATWTPQRPLNGEYDFVFANPSQWVTGDFTIEWETSTWAGDTNFIGFYDSPNITTTTGFLNGRIYFLQNWVATYSVPSGTNRYKINRIGYVVKFFLNDVELYSGTQTQANFDLIKRPVFSFNNYSASTAIIKTTIELPEAPVNYFLYNQVDPVHTTNQFGAISSTGNGSSYNTTPLTGNFDITFNFDAAVTGNDSIFGVKQTLDFTDNYLGFRLFGGFHSYFYGQVRDLITQNSGANAYRITRTGSTIDFYANGVKLSQSASYSGILYLVVRGYNTFNLISTVNSLEAPAYSFSPSLKPTNIALSNNNRTAENTQAINYPSAPVVPSIMLNSGKKVYSEFTVENVATSTTIAFGAFFRTGEPSVSDLSSNSVTLPGGNNPAQSRVVYQGGTVYVGTSNVVNFGTLTSNMIVGLGIDLVANTAFVTKNGVKIGSDFSITAALPGSDRVFFAVGPNQAGERFTISATPAYTLPSGYEYIGTAEIPNPSLKLSFDTNFNDSSANSYSLISSGSPVINTSVKKTGIGSLQCPTNSDYLSLDITKSNLLGNGDFTIEGYIYPTSTAGGYGDRFLTFHTGSNDSNGMVFYMFGSNPSFNITSASAPTQKHITEGSVSVNLNTWNHFAFVKSGNNMYWFVKGQLAFSGNFDNTNIEFTKMWIGLSPLVGGVLQGFHGYIDEIKVTKSALYLAQFTPV